LVANLLLLVGVEDNHHLLVVKDKVNIETLEERDLVLRDDDAFVVVQDQVEEDRNCLEVAVGLGHRDKDCLALLDKDVGDNHHQHYFREESRIEGEVVDHHQVVVVGLDNGQRREEVRGEVSQDGLYPHHHTCEGGGEAVGPSKAVAQDRILHLN
jgi:hypothetical protein